MSDGLKPCPFCGSEASMESGIYDLGDEMYVFAHVECLSCRACGSGFTEADSPVEMVEHLASDAWNRRAERTCREEWVPGSVGGTSVPVCSNCGRGWEAAEVYCPNCGARVVDE